MMDRVMIAAPSSGTGKTTIVCGLLKALLNRNMDVASFKCGPDYIDPMFHRKVIGVESYNLDLFLQTEEQTKGFFVNNCKEISVVEGVMGYYDGVGATAQASSYEVAAATNTPVVLVVRPKGQSLSVAALIKGFLEYKEDSNIAGIIMNGCSENLYKLLKPAVEALNLRVYGYLPTINEIEFKSRHLGLITADEIYDYEQKIEVLAKKTEQTIDVDGLIELAKSAPKIEGEIQPLEKVVHGKVVAVAKDSAFCFYYEDNLNVLKELGCEIKTFSPLKDKELPKGTSCIYIGGGYPELYLKELSQNTEMKDAINSAIGGGTPTIAECGGFMYLCEEIDGQKMVGALLGSCFNTNKLSRFGYVELTAQEEGAFFSKGEKIRAHEFHYWDCTLNGQAFTAKKPVTGKEWKCARNEGNLLAGFAHIYFRSNPDILRRFVLCGK